MEQVKIILLEDILGESGLRPVARSGAALLFDLSTSERLLQLCESVGVGILGIEGFTLSENDLVPDMDFIADFSALLAHDAFEKESISMARKFLAMATQPSDLLFEYVLARRSCIAG